MINTITGHNLGSAAVLRTLALTILAIALALSALATVQPGIASADTGTSQAQTIIDDSIDSGISIGQDCDEDFPIEGHSANEQTPDLRDGISAPQCLLPGIPC